MQGYAIIDFETTGLSPGRTDRVVEIAVICTDDNGQIEQTLETLINPRRDVGPTSIHGVTAADILTAPTFDQIAPSLSTMLHDRRVIAHNAGFDSGFLTAEFNRCGESHDLGQPLCTMRIAGQSGLPAKLELLALQLGVQRVGVPHSAMSDARLTLDCLFHVGEQAGSGAPFRSHTPAAPPPAIVLPRVVVADANERRRAFLTVPHVDDDICARYLDVLADVLADGTVDHGERIALKAYIRSAAWPQDTVDDLHFRYLTHVAETAAADGHVDQDEWRQILSTAYWLGIDERVGHQLTALALTQRVDDVQFRLGMTVCFTGDSRIPRAELEQAASAAGLEVKSSMSKKVDVLVAADPASQSGKAAKARQLGRPVTEYEPLIEFLRRSGLL